MTRFTPLIALVARPHVAIGLTVGLAFAVAVVTLTPSQNLPSAPGGEKMHHVIAFASLAVPLALARPRAFVWIVLLVSAYGALIELIQPHVGRHGSFTDALANTGLARKMWRAPTEEPGGVLWETGTDRRRSFGVKRCGWH